MIYIGIDPGKTGAVAVLDGGGHLLEVSDTPVARTGRASDHGYDVLAMADILRRIHQEDYVHERQRCMIERQQAMQGRGKAQAPSSAFKQGTGWGIWLGILGALRVSVELCAPQEWRMYQGLGRGHRQTDRQRKEASRQLARELFPLQADVFELKKHHGRAEAALIARWLWLKERDPRGRA